MNVAFIPVRGGSKSIPLKNIKVFCGKPLVYWTIKASVDCEQVNKVFVSTDSQEIKNVVASFGLEKVVIIDRSSQTASDTASTESAMLEFAEKHVFDNIVLVQATSPLLTANDLKKGFEVYADDAVDSVLSVVKQKRFCWKYENDGTITASNYDYLNRPRRQDFDGFLVENGAFYITSRENLLKSQCRLSGNIKCVEMPEDTFFEIDEPSDWEIMEGLMKKRLLGQDNSTFVIKMFLTDSDGCLTDGGMYYSEAGDEMKKFNTKDGMGLRLLQENGVITGIITGEDIDLVKRRAQKLKLDICKVGIKDKLTCIKDICTQYGISIKEVAYVGDDINDIEVIQNVGYGCCVADATNDVKAVAKYISSRNGGDGAVREIIDHILKMIQ